MSKQPVDLWPLAEKLAAREYDIDISEEVLTNGEKVYLVENPELPGCMAYGATLEEAIDNLEEARVDFIYYMLVDGLDIPDPRSTHTTTGTGDLQVKASFKAGSGVMIDRDEGSAAQQRRKTMSFSVITSHSG